MSQPTGLHPARQVAAHVENQAVSFEPLWTTADVARYQRVSVRFVQRQVSAGKLPAPIYIGRLPRWKPSVIREHIAKGGCA
jgi:hypothetical protein